MGVTSHAAVSSQLRIPSLTPSHKFSNPFHYNKLQARIAILAIVTHRVVGTYADSLSTA